MRIGYARISTRDQNQELQLDALDRAGCKRIFTDKLSGAQVERPGLSEALSHLREADTLVVWKLDRLGRSVKGLVDLKLSFLEHLTHTSFISRKVGFSRRCPSILPRSRYRGPGVMTCRPFGKYVTSDHRGTDSSHAGCSAKSLQKLLTLATVHS